jgi:hypothetical protein
LAYIKLNESVKVSDRIGQIGKNNFGSKIIITKYNNTKDIDIYFPDTNYTAYNREYKDFMKGRVSSLYDKTILGVGCFGVGEYKSALNSKATNQYRCWINMLHRCYDNKLYKTHPTYINCIVCDKWLNFQNFAKWYDNNYYEIDGEEMCLDKDILLKGNKIYSPETCVFAPIRINGLFKTNNVGDLPPGISAYFKKYRVYCYANDSNTYLGAFETVEESFKVYKDYKENIIKLLADKYRDKIPQKLYDAMYKYEVEITD